jgi:hypothetical protein
MDHLAKYPALYACRAANKNVRSIVKPVAMERSTPILSVRYRTLFGIEQYSKQNAKNAKQPRAGTCGDEVLRQSRASDNWERSDSVKFGRVRRAPLIRNYMQLAHCSWMPHDSFMRDRVYSGKIRKKVTRE